MENHWAVLAGGNVKTPTTPEELWESAVSYFMWCDSSPIRYKKVIQTGKNAGGQATEESQRPYTIKGLCLHCGITEEYISAIKQSRDEGDLYYSVIMRILYVIYVQNQELATVGVYNAVFVSRILGIGDQETPGGKLTISIVRASSEKLANSELEVLEKLDLENGEVVKRD